MRQLLLKAARDGYRVRRDHIFIDTHTGKIANRPAFDAMKALVKRGGVKAVLIYNVDRLARKTLDALTLATEFKRYGAKLDFVETPYEDSAYGRFTFTQMSAVAELIGEKIVTDSKRGREEAMDEGWLPHRTPCYGYKCLSKREVLTGLSRPRWILENGKRVAAPANERHPQLLLLGDAKMEAAVHLAFALADQGRSLYSIANHLNEAGILSAGKPGQHEAGLWGTVSVGQAASQSHLYRQAFLRWPRVPLRSVNRGSALSPRAGEDGRYEGRARGATGLAKSLSAAWAALVWRGRLRSPLENESRRHAQRQRIPLLHLRQYRVPAVSAAVPCPAGSL